MHTGARHLQIHDVNFTHFTNLAWVYIYKNHEYIEEHLFDCSLFHLKLDKNLPLVEDVRKERQTDEPNEGEDQRGERSGFDPRRKALVVQERVQADLVARFGLPFRIVEEDGFQKDHEEEHRQRVLAELDQRDGHKRHGAIVNGPRALGRWALKDQDRERQAQRGGARGVERKRGGPQLLVQRERSGERHSSEDQSKCRREEPLEQEALLARFRKGKTLRFAHRSLERNAKLEANLMREKKGNKDS
jgi:hypothetical protein